MTPEDKSSPEIKRPRVRRISVKKLFGTLNHDVRLNSEDRVTILHGINGVGKTKLLEMTAHLTAGLPWRLAEIPFEELRLEFDDDSTVRVIRDERQLELEIQDEKKPTIGRAILKFVRGVVGGDRTEEFTFDSASDEFRRNGRSIGLPPWIEPVGAGWLDRRTHRVMSTQEVSRSVGLPRRLLERGSTSDKVLQFVSCHPAHLIETQRLLRVGGRRGIHDDDEGALVMTVSELAAELRSKIGRTQEEFARKTQALDRTLTERVLKAEIPDASIGSTLQSRLEALDQHRKRLELVGLLDAGAFGPTLPPSKALELKGDRAMMISVHTDDTEAKFRVLDPLADRLELLLNSMNEKLAAPKRLMLDRERQLAVQRKNGDAIPLEQLSSGEQHELVLLYDLAFRIEPNTLVLIDEPELSLHPVWQQQFLGDILKIAERRQFDVLLATHSPYIIGDRIDLCWELKPEGNSGPF